MIPTVAVREHLILEVDHGIATVSLNRPGVLNALDEPLLDDLVDLLESLADDERVRCVVLRGEGRVFSTGVDIATLARNLEDSAAAPSADADRRRSSARRSRAGYVLATMPKPTIAEVHGQVVGAGLALMLAADIRIAHADTLFRGGFAERGLCGDLGISVFLSRAAGDTRARSILIEDREFCAADAEKWGVVTRTVEHHLRDKVIDTARRLADGPTLAYARMKANLLDAGASISASIDFESMSAQATRDSRDHLESTNAWRERRVPVFEGA
jgi:2-(1,2-epoxy-1,2-dihydrophenyl)acetyl-CoA isomerase